VEDVIVFEGRPGDFVRVKDIARVHYDFADPVVRSSVGNRHAITLFVRASEQADRLGTALGVKAYLEQRRATLPADVDLLLVNDDSVATSSMLDVLISNAAAGIVLSFAAMIGIAGLMGVIVNDALVMLDRMNLERKLHSKRGDTLLHDRQIVECASVRLRPVVITTVTTCAGLFPAAYELGGSNDLITPMIMAMFWGVLVASFTTLLLLPCFYAMERDLMVKLNPGHARQTLEEVIMYN
jgi:multidrug efflux pump subunit AcrB